MESYPSYSSSPRMNNIIAEAGDWFKELGRVLTGRPTIQEFTATAAKYQDADKERTLPGTQVLMEKPQHIVVGVLLKYVNLGSGYRDRVFVLHEGVLRYYKVLSWVSGSGVNVSRLLEYLRTRGEVFLVGVEISMLERRHAKHAEPSSPYAELPPALGEISLSVGAFRESHSDARKLYVHTGMQSLTLRAETADDRWVWIAALRASKLRWGARGDGSGAHEAPEHGLSVPSVVSALGVEEAIRSFPAAPHASAAQALPPSELDAALLCIREALLDLELGDSKEERPEATPAASPDQPSCSQPVPPALLPCLPLGRAYARVEAAVARLHERLLARLEAEARRREEAVGLALRLEEDKRQLETAMVVAGGHEDSAALDPRESSRGSSRGSEEGGVGSEDEGQAGDESDDEFYDADADAEQYLGASLSALELASALGAPEPAARQRSLSGMSGGRASHSRRGSMTIEPAPLAAEEARAPSQTATPRGAGFSPRAEEAGADDAQWLARHDALDEAAREVRRRGRLPRPEQVERQVSLWSLIKGMVGKDLSKVCLPVYFNEPLSALQTSAEGLEYSALLDRAAAEPPRSAERLLRVAAFAVSHYAATLGRTAKPFNPLLGETYEMMAPERGFRFLAEKVVHHPTVIASRAEGRDWVYSSDAELQSRFWGRSIELRPVGVLRVDFGDGDAYAWNKVVSTIHNLVLGKVYVDHGGLMRVRCVGPDGREGLVAKIRFKEGSLFGDRDPRRVRGHLEQGDTRYERPLLQGHWDGDLEALMPDGTALSLWRAAPPPPEPTRYCLGAWAIALNEMPPEVEARAAPTDCRRRPDQRALEQGRYDAADAEKQRLEVKQRAARKAAEAGESLHPRWFKPAGEGGENRPKYAYAGGYWDARKKGVFEGCRDIFGQ